MRVLFIQMGQCGGSVFVCYRSITLKNGINTHPSVTKFLTEIGVEFVELTMAHETEITRSLLSEHVLLLDKRNHRSEVTENRNGRDDLTNADVHHANVDCEERK